MSRWRLQFGDAWDDAAREQIAAVPGCQGRDPSTLIAAGKALQTRWPHWPLADPRAAVGLACEQTGPQTFAFRPDTWAAVQDRRAADWRRDQATLRAQLLGDVQTLTSHQTSVDRIAREALTYVTPLEAIVRSWQPTIDAKLERLEDRSKNLKLVNDVVTVVATVLSSLGSLTAGITEILAIAIQLGNLAYQMRAQGRLLRSVAGLEGYGAAMEQYADLIEAIESTVREADRQWSASSQLKIQILSVIGGSAAPGPAVVAPPVTGTPPPPPITPIAWKPLVGLAAVLAVLWAVLR